MSIEKQALNTMHRHQEEAGVAFLGWVQFDVPEFNAVKSALEKQIPKKPIPARCEIHGHIVAYICPNCKNDYLGQNEYKFDRCEYCGQALDWSEAE